MCFRADFLQEFTLSGYCRPWKLQKAGGEISSCCECWIDVCGRGTAFSLCRSTSSGFVSSFGVSFFCSSLVGESVSWSAYAWLWSPWGSSLLSLWGFVCPGSWILRCVNSRACPNTLGGKKVVSYLSCPRVKQAELWLFFSSSDSPYSIILISKVSFCTNLVVIIWQRSDQPDFFSVCQLCEAARAMAVIRLPRLWFSGRGGFLSSACCAPCCPINCQAFDMTVGHVSPHLLSSGVQLRSGLGVFGSTPNLFFCFFSFFFH